MCGCRSRAGHQERSDVAGEPQRQAPSLPRPPQARSAQRQQHARLHSPTGGLSASLQPPHPLPCRRYLRRCILDAERCWVCSESRAAAKWTRWPEGAPHGWALSLTPPPGLAHAPALGCETRTPQLLHIRLGASSAVSPQMPPQHPQLCTEHSPRALPAPASPVLPWSGSAERVSGGIFCSLSAPHRSPGLPHLPRRLSVFSLLARPPLSFQPVLPAPLTHSINVLGRVGTSC